MRWIETGVLEGWTWEHAEGVDGSETIEGTAIADALSPSCRFYTEHCKLLPSPTSAGGAADCTATVTQQMVNSAGSTLSDVQTASTLITDGLKSMEIPVTITAGVEKLAGGGATTTGTSPAATSSGAPAAPGEAKPNAGAKMGGRSWGASVAAAAVGVLLVAAA